LGKKGVYQDGKIAETSVDGFADGKQVSLKDHPHRRNSRVKSVKRARQRIGETEYNLVFNNCEHFVNWCIEGEKTSEQVNDFLAKPSKKVMKNTLALIERVSQPQQQGDTRPPVRPTLPEVPLSIFDILKRWF
jgi:hypothetical protein